MTDQEHGKAAPESKAKKAPIDRRRKAAGGFLTKQSMLLLNKSSVELLTNGGRELIRFVSVDVLPSGSVVVKPVRMKSGTANIVMLAEERRVCLARLDKDRRYAAGQSFLATWDDISECLVLTPDHSKSPLRSAKRA